MLSEATQVLRGDPGCAEFQLPLSIDRNNTPVLCAFQMTTAIQALTHLPESVSLDKCPKSPTYAVIISIDIEVDLRDPVEGSAEKGTEGNVSGGTKWTVNQKILDVTAQRLLRAFPARSLLHRGRGSPLFETQDYLLFLKRIGGIFILGCDSTPLSPSGGSGVLGFHSKLWRLLCSSRGTFAASRAAQ